MEKIKPVFPDDEKAIKINELIEAHNKTVEAIKHLIINYLDDGDGTVSEEINSILNS